MRTSPPDLVCPRCHGELAWASEAVSCRGCARRYPILCGIADFRLQPGPYLSLPAERAKAEQLHRVARSGTFDDVVAHYYAITDDVPRALAARYVAYVRSAPSRAKPILDELAAEGAGGRLIDLGCGTGGTLAAAEGRPFAGVIGLDHALRWLVIAQQRCAELGFAAPLVCADVEAPPFRPESFDQAVAADLLEHVREPARALQAVRRLLRPGGTLWLSAANRYCPGPHSSVGIWGIGYLPASWRRALLLRVRGVDSMRHTHLLSPGEVVRLLEGAGFERIRVRPRRVGAEGGAGRPRIERALFSGYRRIAAISWLAPALVRFGPAFEIICRRPRAPAGDGGRTEEELACGSG